jgi:flagellar basal body-associated protein FliL
MRVYLIVVLACLLAASSAFGSGHGGGSAHKSEGKKPAKKKEAKKSAGGGHGEQGGHGGSATEVKEAAIPGHVADVERILSLVSGKEKKHDPRLYVEVDLGEFRVTHAHDMEELRLVKFHLYAVLPEQALDKWTAAHEARQQRARDAVLSVVQAASWEEIADPNLGNIKAELVSSLNRVLENDDLRDVAFSTFAIDRL